MGPPLGPVLSGILLFALATSSTADPKCSLGCKGTPGNIFKYEPGTNYKYKLEGTTETKLAGSTDTVAKLGLSAVADVSALPDCGYVLKLLNVQLTGPDGKSYPGGEEFTSQPIKFSMSDGKVDSKICTDNSENQNSLNIKRAVISLLQSSGTKKSGTTSMHETDIFGTCPTSFRFSESGNTIHVKKSRDLNSCAYREDIHGPFLVANPYFEKSDHQASPLISASLKVDQEIEAGVLKSAKGEEHYHYNVRQTMEPEAEVTVHTSLKLISKGKGAPATASASHLKSIIFETPHQREGTANSKEILNALKQACNSMDPNVKENGAKNFRALVNSLAHANKDTILSIYNQAKSGAVIQDKETAKKVLLDGILRAESGDSVEAMAELLKGKEITGLKAKMWLLSLGMVKHATRSSLKSVMPLLEGEPSAEAYLGIGMLAGKFCREHQCEGIPEVDQLEAKLAAPLSGGCHPSTHDAEDHLIASLKGLGNIQYLSPEIVTRLSKCAGDKTARTRVRVAALETIRSDPKKEQFKATAKALLKDVEEDSEIRIKAYQALVKCACPRTAAFIQEVLDNEPIYQVGSYIVSHLKNVQATTSPEWESSKHHYASIKTDKKFPFDFRKYSMNHEVSYFLDSTNVGAIAESNVIFSQKSYVPRSVSLNLTTQLFGHSFNWLEFDARVENFEYILEKWFGPKGHFRTKDGNEVLQEGKDTITSLFNKISDRYQKTMRPKRSTTRAELEAVEKRVKMNNEITDHGLDLDVSMRVQGSEVGWFNYHSSDPDYHVDTLLDQIFKHLQSSVDKAKNVDIDYKKNFLFLDAEITYPTGMGLPLKIDALGSSAIRLKFDGKFDLPAIMKNPKDADIKFQLIPSAAVELTGVISVDGGLVESGVKVSMTLHSSTGSDLTLRILDGHGVDINFGIPLEQQDIISIKTNALSVVREKGHEEVEHPIKFTTKRKEYEGCFDQVNYVTGLTFCGEMKMPWEDNKILLPVFGPSKFSLSIIKDDPALTSYHCKIYLKRDKDTTQTMFEVLLDTPNTKIHRKMNFLVDYASEPKRYLKIDAISPYYSAKFDGSIVNTNKEMSVNAKFNNNGEEYLLKFGALVNKGGKVTKYEPVFEYKAPESAGKLIGRKGSTGGKQSYYVSGSVDVEGMGKGSKFTLHDLTLHTPRDALVLNGKIETGVGKMSTDLKFKNYDEEVTIKSHGEVSEDQDKIKFELEVLPIKHADFGFSILWDYKFKENEEKDEFESLESKLVVVHGPDPKSDKARVTVYNYFEQKQDQIGFKSENYATYPLLKIDAKFNWAISSNGASYYIKGHLNDYKGESSLDAKIKNKNHYDYSVDWKGSYMDNGFHLTTMHDIVEKDKSKFVNKLQLQPGGKYEYNAVVIHKLDNENDFNFHVDSELKLPTSKAMKLIAGAKHNEEECKTEFKASMGAEVLADIEILHKLPSHSGQFKVLLPSHVDTHGQYSFKDHNLKGNAELELSKFKRKMNGNMDLKINSPKYSGTIDFCWDTSNPKKSVKIETDTVVDNTMFSTKNKLHYKEYKTELNAKGKMTGSWLDGTVSGEAEAVLPNNRHVIGKVSRSLHATSGHTDGEWVIDLIDHEKKGDSPRKVSLKLVGKNIDLEKGLLDGQGSLSYVTPAKKNMELNANFKTANSGDSKWIVNGQMKATGSLLPHPANLKLETEFDDSLLSGKVFEDGTYPQYSYKLTGSTGPDFTVEWNGKSKDHTISTDLMVKLPQKYAVHDLKWVSVNHIDVIPKNDHPRKVSSQNSLSWNGDKYVKVNGEVSEEEHGAGFKFDWQSHDHPKRSLSGSAHYKMGQGSEPCKGDMNMAMNWEGKTADLKVKVESPHDGEQSSLHVFGSTPALGKFDFLFKNKFIKEGTGFHADSVISVGDDKMTSSAKVEITHDTTLVDIVADHAAGKSKLYVKYEKKNDQHYVSDVKIKWTGNGGGSLAFGGEVDFKDDFSLKVHGDSPQLKLNKYQLEIDARENVGKTPGKKIMFSAKSADKVLYSGSATYNVKVSGSVKTLEATGSIKIKENTVPLTFKAVLQPHEDGEKTTIEGKFDEYKFTGHMIKTPNEFSFERELCKADKTCSKTQIISKVKGKEPFNQETLFLIKLDLLSLINPQYHDLMFKLSTIWNTEKMAADMELQWSPEGKIKYNEYIDEHKAGFSLVLPKRTVEGELTYDFPKMKDGGAMKIEGSLWLDKVKSPKRMHFLITSEASRGEGSILLSGETKFSHPKPTGYEDYSINGKLTIRTSPAKPDFEMVDGHAEIDIFKTADQKIVLDLKVKGSEDGLPRKSQLTIKSTGCNMNVVLSSEGYAKKTGVLLWQKAAYVDSTGSKREASLKFQFSPKKLTLLMKLPSFTILEMNYATENIPNGIRLNGVHNFAGMKYKESLELKKPYQLQYYTEDKNFEIKGEAKKDYVGLTIDFHKTNVANVQIDLSSDNFLKYDFKAENIKNLYNALSAEAMNFNKEYQTGIRKTIETAKREVESLEASCQKANPDMLPMIEYYKTELSAMRQELISDKSFESMGGNLRQSLSTTIEKIVLIMEEMSHFWNSLIEHMKEGYDKLTSVLKQSLPEFTKSFEHIGQLLINIMEEYLKFSLQVFDYCVDQLKEHEADIKMVLDALTSYLNECGKIISDMAKELKVFLESLFEIMEPLKATIMEPLMFIQEKWEHLELSMPEEITMLYTELVNQIRDLMPTEELSKLFDTCSSFIEKLMKNEKVDVPKTLEQVRDELIAAIKSVMHLVPSVSSEKLLNPSSWITLPALSAFKISTGSLKVSVINWLLLKNHPDFDEILSTYFNPSLNPLDHIPPFESTAIVMGGKEYVTFDGHHYSFKGTCSYVLAEDYVDGNFSLVANVANGKLKSVTMFDAHDSIEIRHGQNALVNGKPMEFPAKAGHLVAWRRPRTVGMWNDAGVLVICGDDCNSCMFRLSGFYFNKVRGLLGNPNYEPYDDMAHPEGKVSQDSSAFGNAWKTDQTCSNVPSSGAHSHKNEQMCTKFFTDNDDLGLCFYSIDPKPFRDACDHLVQEATTPEAKKAAACGVATAYSALCQGQGHILVEVPDTCVTCTMDKEKVPYGKSVKVEIPGKSADVLFVVEQLKGNEELFKNMVPQLVTSLTSDFKEKGISDVHFGLVGFGNPHNYYHNYYTTNGEITFNGNAENLHFYESMPRKNETLVDKYRMFRDDFNNEIGNTPRSRVYWDIWQSFKFRPHALKTIVGIHSKPCETGKLIISLGLFKTAVGFGLYKYGGIDVNYVIPGTLKYKGMDKPIVGYSSDHLYTFDDAKQKPLKGMEMDDDDLEDDFDICAQFTSALDGNVFSGRNFLNEKPGGRKKFIGIMSRRIVESSTDHKDTYHCECTKTYGSFPHTRCESDDIDDEAVEVLSESIKTKKATKG